MGGKKFFDNSLAVLYLGTGEGGRGEGIPGQEITKSDLEMLWRFKWESEDLCGLRELLCRGGLLVHRQWPADGGTMGAWSVSQAKGLKPPAAWHLPSVSLTISWSSSSSPTRIYSAPKGILFEIVYLAGVKQLYSTIQAQGFTSHLQVYFTLEGS